VQARHTEIQRIEKTIIELADLFTQMEQLVLEQEAMVENIDQRGEEVTTNVVKAQEEIGVAVEKARSRRRKKWWCLLILRKYILFYIVFRALFPNRFQMTMAPRPPFFYHGTLEDSCHHCSHPGYYTTRYNSGLSLEMEQIPLLPIIPEKDSGWRGKLCLDHVFLSLY